MKNVNLLIVLIVLSFLSFSPKANAVYIGVELGKVNNGGDDTTGNERLTGPSSGLTIGGRFNSLGLEVFFKNLKLEDDNALLNVEFQTQARGLALRWHPVEFFNLKIGLAGYKYEIKIGPYSLEDSASGTVAGFGFSIPYNTIDFTIDFNAYRWKTEDDVTGEEDTTGLNEFAFGARFKF